MSAKLFDVYLSITGYWYILHHCHNILLGVDYETIVSSGELKSGS